MFLKNYPLDVPVGVLVQQSFIMLQSTLMRVQELQAEDTASLKDDDRRALDDLIALLRNALEDAVKLKKPFSN